MAAAITTLATKPERLRRDQAERLKAVLQEIEAQVELPTGLMRDLFGVVAKRTVSHARWTFVMLSPAQNNTVVQHLVEHSSRPLVAVRLWAMCFEHLRDDTGEILLSRDKIAEALHELPNNVSAIMGELEACGAIIRRREKVAGMRGPGLVRYYMNPRVATHLAGAERDRAQETAPPVLSIVPGGRAP